MKKVSAAFLATICEGTTFESVQEWVNRFNAGMATEIPGAAVVLEMNKRGKKIPVEFCHNDTMTTTKVTPGGMKDDKIHLTVTTSMNLIVPMNEELDLKEIAKQIQLSNTNSGLAFEKKPSVNTTKSSTKKSYKRVTKEFRRWTTDEDDLVMSTDIPMGELTETLNRTAVAIYTRRTALRKKQLSASK